MLQLLMSNNKVIFSSPYLGWALLDLNQRPDVYETPALTAELKALTAVYLPTMVNYWGILQQLSQPWEVIARSEPRVFFTKVTVSGSGCPIPCGHILSKILVSSLQHNFHSTIWWLLGECIGHGPIQLSLVCVRILCPELSVTGSIGFRNAAVRRVRQTAESSSLLGIALPVP